MLYYRALLPIRSIHNSLHLLTSSPQSLFFPPANHQSVLYVYEPALQYSCLENPMDGGAWKAAVHGVAEGWTRLSDFTFTFHFHALEKEMATHSSVLAWRIPGTGEPGGLPSQGSHRVGHDWSDLAAAAAAETYHASGIWRRQGIAIAGFSAVAEKQNNQPMPPLMETKK